MERIVWTTDFLPTGFKGYFRSPWSIDETVGRLAALSGQPIESGDKTEFDFSGYWNGEMFNLYDYKADGQIHIGSRLGAYNTEQDGLDIVEFSKDLIAALTNVTPLPFTYRPTYGSYE